MNSYIATNLVYNELEYFCYLNHWLLFLFFFIITFYSILKITTFYFNKIYYNDTFIEFVCTLFSLLFLLFIISPSLIILLDIDSIIMPSFIIYSLGYQWAWTYSILYLHSNIGYTSYYDHYIISSYFYETYANINIPYLNNTTIINLANNTNINIWTICIPELIFKTWVFTFRYFYPIFTDWYNKLINEINNLIYGDHPNTNKGNIKLTDSIDNNHSNNMDYMVDNITVNNLIVNNMLTNYLFEVNTYLVIPLWSCIKIYCFSFDVIHSLSFYSFGFKLDAIPGRINLTSSLRSLVKGVNRGFCYELCGEQHNTMLNTWILF